MPSTRFTKEHEWIRVEGDAAVCGITDYAQKALGDIVYVELPAVGRKVKQGESIAVVESAKAASEVYAPIDGEVTAINDNLAADPGKVNVAAAGDGWFFKLKPASAAQAAELMDDAAYQNYLKGLAGYRGMRYLPLTDNDRKAMLSKIGVGSVDALFADVPQEARLKGFISGLPNHQPEYEVERVLSALAAKNIAAGSCPSFLGAGAYRHHVPASVDQLILRGEFLTSYTPYQPEVSQGTLQYLFEFQTQVAMLTGMDVANASMYDGASACAEAVMMANRVTKRGRAIISGNLHPHYREVVETMGQMTGFTVDARAPSPKTIEALAPLIDDQTSCVVVQNPDLFGNLHDYTALGKACAAKGALLIIAVTEIVSLGLIQPPGAMGADIVVAEGQGLGNGLNFGGPYVGLFACREKYLRQMPGRVCGQTLDAEGRRGFVLTLSAREQHIRREKATSNICTNSGLCALAFTIHLSLLGEAGMTKLAELNHAKACQLADRLGEIPGCKVLNESFFNEFTLELPKSAAEIVERLAKKPILAGVPVSRFYRGDKSLANLLLITATELTTETDMNALADALKEACK